MAVLGDSHVIDCCVFVGLLGPATTSGCVDCLCYLKVSDREIAIFRGPSRDLNAERPGDLGTSR